MHGVRKVRSPAEIAERKQKELIEKGIKHRSLSTAILSCKTAWRTALQQQVIDGDRINDNADVMALEVNGMTLTQQLLEKNPDFYTAWNFRKEMYLSRMKNIDDDDEKQQQSLLEGFASELKLTETCIPVNPKSYSTWHHRRWVLEQSSAANWAQEMKLCDRFLDLDSRNFHCWDHRRWVACRHKDLTSALEFEYTSHKINQNFSNYSAWHYRSTLLPLLHPQSIEEKERTLVKEFELVQAAFFTEPEDQSAWLYHRWLLGRVLEPLCIHQVMAERSENSTTITLVFSHPVAHVNAAILLDEEAFTGVVWECCRSNKKESLSPLWKATAPLSSHSYPACDIIVRLNSEIVSSYEVIIPVDGIPDIAISFDVGVMRSASVLSVPVSSCPVATRDVLELELESCGQLLDMEPDSKWTLLTKLLLMYVLDSVRYRDSIFEMFNSLLIVDPIRRGYYVDLRSKFIIELDLGPSLSNAFSTRDYSVNLSGLGLITLYYPERLACLTRVCLDNNNLRKLPSGAMLGNVENISIAGNSLSTLNGLEELVLARHLHTLSFDNNNIMSIDVLGPLHKLVTLRSLFLRGNPVVSTENYRENVKDLIPQLDMLDGLAF